MCWPLTWNSLNVTCIEVKSSKLMADVELERQRLELCQQELHTCRMKGTETAPIHAGCVFHSGCVFHAGLVVGFEKPICSLSFYKLPSASALECLWGHETHKHQHITGQLVYFNFVQTLYDYRLLSQYLDFAGEAEPVMVCFSCYCGVCVSACALMAETRWEVLLW